ncbi:MAG: cobalt-precorrin 5A hydrolase [Ruminococcus sp.]|nr:cobalt-precorrin 5A hydrolase [Ruminococcus sp.]
MNISVVSLTEKGRILSTEIVGFLKDNHTVMRYCFRKHTDESAEIFDNICQLTGEIFSKSDALIFVCACGIAVRAVCPHIVSKISDPAIIVVDDCGKFVVPVLSGHIGGANRLAEIIAEKIKAVPVVTTATDTSKKFSPDSFAVANGLIISDMKNAKEIASAVLDGEIIGLVSDYECRNVPDGISLENNCRTGICISKYSEIKPFSVTLNLVPKNLIIGIGCKRGVSCETIEKRVSESLLSAEISAERICAVTTIDIKSEEKGLNEYCQKNNFVLKYFTADELMNLHGDFTTSEFVRKTTGADNVCERSAVICSGGRLVMRKNAGDGVTVAVAEKPVIIDFERKIL